MPVEVHVKNEKAFCSRCGTDVSVQQEAGQVATSQLRQVLADEKGHVVAERMTTDEQWFQPEGTMVVLRITKGDCAGRFIGPRFGGLATNRAMESSNPVFLENTEYAAWIQHSVQRFFENKAKEVKVELSAIGIETELLPG